MIPVKVNANRSIVFIEILSDIFAFDSAPGPKVWQAKVERGISGSATIGCLAARRAQQNRQRDANDCRRDARAPRRILRVRFMTTILLLPGKNDYIPIMQRLRRTFRTLMLLVALAVGVYLGVMLWSGYWLREPRLQALFPFTSAARD